MMNQENEKIVTDIEETIQSIEIEKMEQQLEDYILKAFENGDVKSSYGRETLERTKCRVAKEIQKYCGRICAINASRLQMDFMLNSKLNFYNNLIYQPILLQYTNHLDNHLFSVFYEKLFQRGNSFIKKVDLQQKSLYFEQLSGWEQEIYRTIITYTEIDREITALQGFVNVILQIENNSIDEYLVNDK